VRATLLRGATVAAITALESLFRGQRLFFLPIYGILLLQCVIPVNFSLVFFAAILSCGCFVA
jgi:hypothetical protein